MAPGELTVKKGDQELKIPFGTCVWATGIAMHPLVRAWASLVKGVVGLQAQSCRHYSRMVHLRSMHFLTTHSGNHGVGYCQQQSVLCSCACPARCLSLHDLPFSTSVQCADQFANRFDSWGK